jgi:hypothetical protein
MAKEQKTTPPSVDPHFANTTLIAWTSAIYGIFWGVWLGLFTERLTQERCTPRLLAELPEGPASILYYASVVGFTILVAAYTYHLVKWLWLMRSTGPNARFASVFRKLGNGILLAMLTVAGVFLLSVSCNVPWPLAWLGAWSTAAWTCIVAAVTLANKGGWR